MTDMKARKNNHFLTAWGLLLGVLLHGCQPAGDQPPANTPEPNRPSRAATDTAATQNQPTFFKPGITEDYTNTDRVIWQKPEMVIDLLGDIRGKTIADIGAGTGFFALRLVREADKVIAIDIDQRFIDYLDSVKVMELPESYQPRLEPRLALPDDPRLKEGETDIVVIVNTYMYIPKRVQYLRTLKAGIADGGQILIIDFKKKRIPIGPPAEIKVPLYQVEEELSEAGFRNIRTNDTALDFQYIVIAEK